MKRFLWISSSIFLLASLLPLEAGAETKTAQSSLPWIEERLVFELSWFKLNAGTAVMEVSGKTERKGEKVYQFSAVTNSNKFVDSFYKVRDRVDSFVSAGTLGSLQYKVHQEEGSFRRDKEIIFDYEKKTAKYTKDKETSYYDIPSFVQDSLSVLYYLRTRELAVGKPIAIDVFDDRKLWQVEVQVLKKERVETPAGIFDTVLVKPILNFEGIFQQKGDVYIWVTDDARKMPVKMRSKVKIGSISADLIEYKYSKQ